MSETKPFPTADVLSAITGRLVSERHMDAIYEVLNFMTGESLFTHQLPRVGREAAKVLVAHQPDLAAAIEEADQVNPQNWRGWAARWVKRYGPTISVPTMTADQHRRVDAIAEAVEMVGEEKVVVVKV